MLPAETFANGPTSGRQLGSAPINGVTPPFVNKQPVQGFSAVLDNKDGSFQVMADNGYGSLENSSDFNLRVYRIRPRFETAAGGDGTIGVEGFIELHDPDRRIPFAITNHFSPRRVLTGADFDIESMQRTADGSLWFGEEFGPFILHTDANGKVLEAPIPLPDYKNGGEVRSPQNPFNEETSAVRVMNAVRDHARMNGNSKAPVFSPQHQLLKDANPTTFAASRNSPPAGSGLAPASSEIFDVGSIKRAGYPVVPYTINDKPRMAELMRLGVDGIISDRPDLLYQAVREFDANNDGTPGDFVLPDGRIDGSKFDAQGHRGGRNLRPENTIPAMEVALDNLMTTLETDTGITNDGIAIQSHDPALEATKCRRADGGVYDEADEVLIKNLTAAELQSRFICDKLFRGPSQMNDRALSPASVGFANAQGMIDPYVPPTLQQLFDFVTFYVNYYETGLGRTQPQAALRAANARQVRFNIETKINPRAEFAERTTGPERFADIVAGTIALNGLTERADVQSFDFRTLLRVQTRFPAIRTVYLFGDFPIFANPSIAGSDEGTNLQPEPGSNTPWLAGLPWPYRVTTQDRPFRAQRSGGFEGMALSSDGTKLLPLLELPLAGDDPKVLLIHEFDIATRRYTGIQYRYRLDARGTNIGDFVMFGPQHGLIIERDPSQGRLDGFKAVYEVVLGAPGTEVGKTLAVDLLNIADPNRISEPAQPGDVGLGERFAFPFNTIEDVVVFSDRRIGVLDDNNFPFSVGRHAGSGRPDDNEFIVIRLANRLVGAPPDDVPPPVIPEAPVAGLLPLAGIALFAAAAAKRRRGGRAAGNASYGLG